MIWKIIKWLLTLLDIKDCTIHRAIEVKLPLLWAVSTEQEWILSLIKWVHFFLGPWLLVCQFINIFNQMELTGEVLNFGHYTKKFFQSLILHQKSPIWLEISRNWHTKSQGPKKNIPILQERGFTPVPWTLLVIRVVLLKSLYGVCNPFCPVVYVAMCYYKYDIFAYQSIWNVPKHGAWNKLKFFSKNSSWAISQKNVWTT